MLMEHLKKQFETNLKSKLAQKATAAHSEESILIKNLKYFDSNNDDHINFNEWQRALEKTGVVVASVDDMKQLFSFYDLDSDSLINCKEFAWMMYSNKPFTHFHQSPPLARRPSRTPPTSKGEAEFECRIGEELKRQSSQSQTPAGMAKGHQVKGNASSSDNPFKTQEQIVPGTRASAADRREIIENFRRVLASRGLRGIIGLAHQFKIADFEKSGEISVHDFVQVVQSLNVPISNADIRSVFETFDRSKKGRISYMEFVAAIKGEMNAGRRAAVELAFKYLDAENRGIIGIKDLLGGYSARNHPLVRAGKKTEEQALTEFIETFEMNKSLTSTDNDMLVTKGDFLDYYNSVSAVVDSNKAFEDLVMSTWRLYGEEAKSAAPVEKKRVGVSQSAPFGTSEEPTDYSTALRPGKAHRGDMQPAGMKLSSVKGQTRQYALRPGERQLVNHFKEMLLSKGLKGVLSFQLSLQSADKHGNKQIAFPDFVQLLKEFRLKYDETNAENLFKVFDKSHSGYISYEDLLNAAIVIVAIVVGRDERVSQRGGDEGVQVLGRRREWRAGPGKTGAGVLRGCTPGRAREEEDQGNGPQGIR